MLIDFAPQDAIEHQRVADFDDVVYQLPTSVVGFSLGVFHFLGQDGDIFVYYESFSHCFPVKAFI